MPLFHDLCGNEHAKRAAEVALVGSHHIVFIGPRDSQAGDFAELVYGTAKQIGQADDWYIQTESWSPCACGHYGTAKCTCSLDSVAMYRDANPLPLADIYVEIVCPWPETLVRWAMNNFTDGHLHIEIATRIRQARINDRPHTIQDMAWNLLRAAANSLEMQPETLRHTVEVAKTIAQMAGTVDVVAAHMAEAIQYRPRGTV